MQLCYVGEAKCLVYNIDSSKHLLAQFRTGLARAHVFPCYSFTVFVHGLLSIRLLCEPAHCQANVLGPVPRSDATLIEVYYASCVTSKAYGVFSFSVAVKFY